MISNSAMPSALPGRDEPADRHDGSTVPGVSPRRPAPRVRADVWAVVTATAAGFVAYLLWPLSHGLPAHGYAVVLLTLATVCAAAAAAVLWLRGRVETDPAVGWVGGGITVGAVAMVLQLMSFPLVAPDGGVLHTNGNGSSLLYLLFHWSLLAGVVAAIGRVPLRWRALLVVVGIVFALACALPWMPTPALLRPDQSFTSVTIVLEQVTAGAALLVAVVWVVRAGRRPPALHAWIAAALLFNAYDTLLNVVAGRRYDHQWWASLTMRVATYAVLAVAAGVTVLLSLRRQEQYAEVELSRRETELAAALQATGQLLTAAEGFTGAVSQVDVARVAAQAAATITNRGRVLVELLDELSGELRLLACIGLDQATSAALASISPGRRLPGTHVLRTGEAIYVTGRERVAHLFADLAGLPALQDSATVAALPLQLATGGVGMLVVADDQPGEWPLELRRRLAGLADQAAQALQRARLFDEQRATADALQHGMLPDRLAATPGIAVTARYLPGARGLRVGGDWYDSLALPDGRTVLVVGDVMGKGAVAAAVMGRARSVVRALIGVDPDPAAVLTGLDTVARELAGDGFFTMLYVLLDPVNGVAEIARAGHLPLLLVHPDGTVDLITGGDSPAVGAVPGPRVSVRVPVPAGATLALFTDGLVEHRAGGFNPGIDRLGRTIAAHRHTGLDELAELLLTLDSGAGEYDDICLLLARLSQRHADTAHDTPSQPPVRNPGSPVAHPVQRAGEPPHPTSPDRTPATNRPPDPALTRSPLTRNIPRRRTVPARPQSREAKPVASRPPGLG